MKFKTTSGDVISAKTIEQAERIAFKQGSGDVIGLISQEESLRFAKAAACTGSDTTVKRVEEQIKKATPQQVALHDTDGSVYLWEMGLQKESQRLYGNGKG